MTLSPCDCFSMFFFSVLLLLVIRYFIRTIVEFHCFATCKNLLMTWNVHFSLSKSVHAVLLLKRQAFNCNSNQGLWYCLQWKKTSATQHYDIGFNLLSFRSSSAMIAFYSAFIHTKRALKWVQRSQSLNGMVCIMLNSIIPNLYNKSFCQHFKDGNRIACDS